MNTLSVLTEVADERARQDAKFPGQVCPSLPPTPYTLARVTVTEPSVLNLDFRTAAELEAIFRLRCERRFEEGQGTWLDILLEEVFEAAAAGDPAHLREELIQVAAVAVRWVENIDEGNA